VDNKKLFSSAAFIYLHRRNNQNRQEFSMKIICSAIITFLISFSLSAQDLSLIDSALAQVDLTRAEVRFDRDEMANWGGDRWRGNYFTMFHNDPFKLPKYGQMNLESFSDNSTNLTALVAAAGRRIDCPVFRGFIGDPFQDYSGTTDTLPLASITRSKNVLVGKRHQPLREKIDLLYLMALDDDFFLKKALKDFDRDKYRKKLFEYFINDSTAYNDFVEELAEAFDFNRLMAGAQDFAELARRMADSLTPENFPDKRIEIKTRRGLVVVGSTGDDSFEYLVPPLLIIDGGGNDTYKISGYPDEYPLSIIVDLAGDDRYLSPDSTRPGIGGAVLGVALVIDKKGNDLYRGYNLTQGAGLFGVGAVLDFEGDDIYSARHYTQGCGAFGAGILADSAGNDSLYCYTASQGYGYTRGCGLLVNFEGDDRYIAEDSLIFNPSPQTVKHNASLAQGVGFGKRADYIDGHSWAGGVGILCDVHGDDIYKAGLFAQGCAYWFAVGMLLDGGGSDVYDGVWYVQGSGAHFGVGYLDDFAGDDRYNASLNMAVGAGHDFTVGYFNERGGDDTYRVPNLSLGGGNANGIGIFHDHNGDDIYETKGGTTLGRANASDNGPRRYLRVFGIFVDGGGNDQYNEDYAANNSRWVGPKSDKDNPNPYEIGVGIDKD